MQLLCIVRPMLASVFVNSMMCVAGHIVFQDHGNPVSFRSIRI